MNVLLYVFTKEHLLNKLAIKKLTIYLVYLK